MLTCDSLLTEVKGIGEKKAKLYKKIGIITTLQLVRHFPRDYLDFSKPVSIEEIDTNKPQLICGLLCGKSPGQHIRKNLTIYRFNAKSSEHDLRITFFNSRFTADSLQTGKEYFFYGYINASLLGYEMTSPIVVSKENIGRLYPVYPATAALSSRTIARDIQNALNNLSMPSDPLPENIKLKFGLFSLEQAYLHIHRPENPKIAQEALRRFSFEDLLLTSIALKKLRQSKRINVLPMKRVSLHQLWDNMVFRPTKAQLRASGEICDDLCSGFLMNRMLQGDVGSGKTLVAAAAAYVTGLNNKQTLMMAPTEILAIQHYKTMKDYLEPFGFEVCLLTGGMSAKDKRHSLKRIASGEAKIIVSTHAVLYSQVKYHALGLAITDEQQRFGVAQRASVQPKTGEYAHTLVMSATPIPRTLSLILHGDLDVSVLDEMPRDRKKILTYHITSDILTRAFQFTKDQLRLGRQAYIVCPLIESDAVSDIQQAVELKERLSKGLFYDCKVELLHGKMSANEKEMIMSRFVSGEIDLLVTTSIVEVGVDVPNTTVMMIQNAERFGLSQLHQLRGRVGRGQHQSYCILVSDAKGDIARKRLEALVKNQDGFFIAEQDLLLRGPGDLLGLRQHGITQMVPDYVFANKELLLQVNEASDDILASDPHLALQKHQSIQRKVCSMLVEVGEALN